MVEEEIIYKKRAKVSIIVLVIMVLGILIWGGCASTDANINVSTEFSTINDNWVQVIEDKYILLEELTDFQNEDTEPIVIERTLPNNDELRNLLFQTVNQEVSVYINDELVYEYKIPEGYEILKTHGSSWHTIPLDSDISGANIRIEFSSQFYRYNVLPQDIYYLYQGELQIVQAYNIWFCNTGAIFMIIFAIISYISSSFWKRESVKKYSLTLGHLYISIGLWIFSEIGILKIFLNNSITNYLLSMLLVRVTPIVYYYFTSVMLKNKSRWFELIEGIVWANLFLSFVVQFVFEISLLETLWITYAIVGIGSIICLICILKTLYLSHKNIKPLLENKYLYYARVILVIGSLLEVYFYYDFQNFGMCRGMPLCISLIIHTLVSRVILVKIESSIEYEKEELQKANYQLQINPLMQEINAHFLFNALHSISYLCKVDTKRADRTVVMLSKYMREYMYLVNSSSNLSFSHELKLIKAYLEIQKIRFVDIKIHFNIEYENFNIPPFCVQPLVENAIVHAFRKNPGVITITSKKYKEYILVIVMDNGQGFDANEGNKGVGINNVRKRIELYGGKLAIKSDANGTVAKIFIPEKIQNIEQGGC